MFTSGTVALVLLSLHLCSLGAFGARAARVPIPPSGDTPHYILLTLATSNFIGIVAARTLHYQFYSWYFHCLPVLAFGATWLPAWASVAIMAAVEVAFNVFPATPWSSALLQVCLCVNCCVWIREEWAVT